MDKQLIRQEVLSKRKSLTPEFIQTASQIICTNLLKLTTNFQKLLVYYPIQNEVDILPFIKKKLSQNKITLYLPYTPKIGSLEIRKLVNLSSLTKDTYGIPSSSLRSDKTPLPEAIIVPCLACDQDKNRLGYGKGYYDRLLTPIVPSFGVCYHFQLYDSLPYEPHDKKLSCVITEKTILN